MRRLILFLLIVIAIRLLQQFFEDQEMKTLSRPPRREQRRYTLSEIENMSWRKEGGDASD